MAGVAKKFNVEHRTSNIDGAALDRFLNKRTSESTKGGQVPKGRFALLSIFLNDRIHYSMLDVQCSMFGVHFFNILALDLLTIFTAYEDASSTSPRSMPRYPVHSVLEVIAADAGETSARC